MIILDVEIKNAILRRRLGDHSMNRALLKLLAYWLFGCVLFAFQDAYAAKLRVTWVAPTTNTDGTPLTDLRSYRIEWGSCNSDGSFGVYQAGINIGAPATSGWIYPTGLKVVCARLYAINSANQLSPPAFASGPVPVKLPQPTH